MNLDAVDRTDKLVDCLMLVCELIETGAACREQLKPLYGFLFDEIKEVIASQPKTETVGLLVLH